jgi:hypothetical protein
MAMGVASEVSQTSLNSKKKSPRKMKQEDNKLV